jgi:hypothetical protein
LFFEKFKEENTHQSFSKGSKGGEELLSKENSTYKAWFFSLKTRIVVAHTSLLILWWNEGDLRFKFGLLGAGK